MVIQNAAPGFGCKLKTDDYYAACWSIINVLRGHSTLRVIASHLAAQGFTTPTGLPFTRDRLATFIKQNKNLTKE
jgi:hypothetical protein